MNFTWKHLITLIWLSKTLYAKHYLIETQDQANVTHTATTPSPTLVTGRKQSGVSCGGHRAHSCVRCPWGPRGYVGQAWCNGQCKWGNGQCYRKGSGCLGKPFVVGPCRARFPRWSVDDGVCKKFVYGGCDGNDNNFRSVAECEGQCSNNILGGCMETPGVVGPCRAHFQRWTFDNGVCRKFVYGGCKGNGNNFRSLTECKKICGKNNQRTCPRGHGAWFGQNYMEFEDNCYLFLQSRSTWKDAQRQCRMRGANLASVHSESENQFIANTLSKNHQTFWIGGRKIRGRGKWPLEYRWIDLSPMSYTNFCPKPDWNLRKRCFTVGWNRGMRCPPNTWESQSCNMRLPFVCKKRL